MLSALRPAAALNPGRAAGPPTTLDGGDGADRFLPGPYGDFTIADFTPGTDTLDLSLLARPKDGPEVTIRIADGSATLAWGALTVALPGAGGLTLRDVVAPAQRRVVIQGD